VIILLIDRLDLYRIVVCKFAFNLWLPDKMPSDLIKDPSDDLHGHFTKNPFAAYQVHSNGYHKDQHELTVLGLEPSYKPTHF
jgi:hypothetical protein